MQLVSSAPLHIAHREGLRWGGVIQCECMHRCGCMEAGVGAGAVSLCRSQASSLHQQAPPAHPTCPDYTTSG